eukprot:1149529-Pelagomonas_calceolata.AAC.4
MFTNPVMPRLYIYRQGLHVSALLLQGDLCFCLLLSEIPTWQDLMYWGERFVDTYHFLSTGGTKLHLWCAYNERATFGRAAHYAGAPTNMMQPIEPGGCGQYETHCMARSMLVQGVSHII